MVKVETRIQLAIKEILVEELEKHLKSGDNFDVVLSIASLITFVFGMFEYDENSSRIVSFLRL